MTAHEDAHIFVSLASSGPVGEPHYADDRYLEGERLARGFEVRDRPADPASEVVHVGGPTVPPPDGCLWEGREPSEGGTVISLASPLRYEPPEEPAYMNPDRGREAKAEAVAQAVRAAVMRGELDPSAILG